VLVKSLIIKRSVIVANGGAIIVDDTAGQADVEEPTELQRFYQGFWKEFIDGLHLDDATQPLPNLTRRGNVFLPMPPSGGEAWVTVYFSQGSKEVGLFLTFTSGAFADLAYAKLVQDREAIERELDVPVEWSSFEGKHSIIASAPFADLRSPQYRSAIKGFLADRLNRYVNVFRPRLARIAQEV
jgi:hypothetical protein